MPSLDEEVSDEESNSSVKSKLSENDEQSEQRIFSSNHAEIDRVVKKSTSKAPTLEFLDQNSNDKFYTMPTANLNSDYTKKTLLGT